MPASGGLRARLGRTLLLQAAFIGSAAVIGVFLASVLLEGVLIRQALRDEAEFFWSSRAADPGHPVPATLNLTGYIGDVPPPLASLGPGYHDWPDGPVEKVVYVDDRDGQRLYLAFDRSGVARLATFFGLLPLAMVLLVLYVSTWLGFRASRRAFSPVIALARRVRELDPQVPDPAAFEPAQLPADADDEVRELAAALARYSQRLNAFIERERHFTRDASHELRSPLTVIQMAAEMLLADPALGETGRRSVDRIRRSARDMQELIGAFLLLARESEVGLPVESVCINDVVGEEVERARVLAEGRPVDCSIRADCRLHFDAPERALSVLLGNLLRNAFSYTDAGEVTVDIGPAGLVIRDTGIGIAPDRMREMYEPFVRADASRRGGHGVGLTIVRRLSDRFGWPVEISSQPGVGTRVEIRFPGARPEPLGPARQEAPSAP